MRKILYLSSVFRIYRNTLFLLFSNYYPGNLKTTFCHLILPKIRIYEWQTYNFHFSELIPDNKNKIFFRNKSAYVNF